MNRIKVVYLHSLIVFLRILNLKSEETIEFSFPNDFSIGIGTSSYQIEGAWNISDKSESVWDQYVHNNPDKIHNRSNGDVACNSYYQYKEDVRQIKSMGLNHYRFSLSWSRILPTGYTNIVSNDGLRYYHELLAELEKNKITPFVTIYHWDHPEALQKIGGWTNELMVDLFGDYARVVFREFGHQVKFFTTINEPLAICRDGYTTGVQAPGYKLGKRAEYLCGHNILKAHARAYHIYNDEFRIDQSGKVGISLPCFHHFLKDENDTILREIAFQFECGRFAHPIFSRQGDYPDIVKKQINERSIIEGHSQSKLPTFTNEWIEYIKGSSDYFGLNHYTSAIVEAVPIGQHKMQEDDEGVVYKSDPRWPNTTSDWLKIVPEGLRNVLKTIKDKYGNPQIYILENGISDNGTLNDVQRIEYLHSYMREMLIAVKQYGCDVRAYTIWSLLDNFEWDRGYSEHFGVIKVNFHNVNRTRTPKESAKWIKTIMINRKLPEI